jgi:hypothetical protein
MNESGELTSARDPKYQVSTLATEPKKKVKKKKVIYFILKFI